MASSLVTLFVPIVVLTSVILNEARYSYGSPEETGKSRNTAELLFVGDIMLGRAVEIRLAYEGAEYPYTHALPFLTAPHLTIGNFEGIVQEQHEPTPFMTFRFSVREEYLKALKKAGFDVLSLANNHSYDYGEDALSYTRRLCEELSLICGGTPKKLDEYSISFRKVNSEKIGFLFLQTVTQKFDEKKAQELLIELKEKSDFQVAYVHWGDEYALTHNASQQKVAEFLIDNGIDAVIGHHPHVVQDIALYKDKPIFYSLGNFIFDQYFSMDVQEGLGVKIILDGGEPQYQLIPFTSIYTRNQPQIMKKDESDILYSRILATISDSDFYLGEDGRMQLLHSEVE